jgi:hypothetical protein
MTGTSFFWLLNPVNVTIIKFIGLMSEFMKNPALLLMVLSISSGLHFSCVRSGKNNDLRLKEARGVIERVLPAYAGQFTLRMTGKSAGQESYTV